MQGAASAVKRATSPVNWHGNAQSTICMVFYSQRWDVPLLCLCYATGGHSFSFSVSSFETGLECRAAPWQFYCSWDGDFPSLVKLVEFLFVNYYWYDLIWTCMLFCRHVEMKPCFTLQVQKKHLQSLWKLWQPDEIFLGETQIAKRLWTTSSTSGLGEWGFWWIWDDVDWCVSMTCCATFHLAIVASFCVVDLAKKRFQAAKFMPHLHGQDVLFVHFSITPTGFLSLPWRNFQRLRRNFTVVSLVVFLSWIKRFKAISLCWCLIDWFIP